MKMANHLGRKEPMQRMGRTGLAAAIFVVGALGGCSSVTEPGGIETLSADMIQARIGEGLVFISMRVVPNAHMEALYEGRVVADAAGCLRLDSPDPATVVWPKGYALADGSEWTSILDADGTVVGVVGGEFSLSGGEVPSLPVEMGFTQADRDLAESRCPGKYWIVGSD